MSYLAEENAKKLISSDNMHSMQITKL